MGILERFPLRPFSDFFDFSRFAVPANVNKAFSRWEGNLQYYFANYLVLGLLFFIYSAITRIFFLLTCLVVSAAWIYLLEVKGSSFSGIDLRKRGFNLKLTVHQSYLFFCFVTVCLFLITSDLILGIPIGFSFLHAAFRKRTMKSKVSTFIDRAKGNHISNEIEKVIETTFIEGEDEPYVPNSANLSRYRTISKEMKEKYFS